MGEAEDHVRIVLPRQCLVVLSGIPASGKSTFAHRHFRPTEVVSSDWCRATICDNAINQTASRDAFDLMYEIIAKRMKFNRLCVADATHLTHASRKPLIDLCGRYGYPACLIVFDVSPDECKRRDAQRPEFRVGDDVIDDHASRRAVDVDRIDAEGFWQVWVLGADEVDRAEVIVETHAAQKERPDRRAIEP